MNIIEMKQNEIETVCGGSTKGWLETVGSFITGKEDAPKLNELSGLIFYTGIVITALQFMTVGHVAILGVSILLISRIL